MLSKACQYAIKSLIYLANNKQQGKIPLKEIAEQIDSPSAFTSKILQQLVAARVIKSTKGGKGGFELDARKHHKLTVGDVISIIDGDDLSQGCFLGLPECSGLNPCPLHFKYLEIKKSMHHSMFNVPIMELIKKDEGIIKVKR